MTSTWKSMHVAQGPGRPKIIKAPPYLGGQFSPSLLPCAFHREDLPLGLVAEDNLHESQPIPYY